MNPDVDMDQSAAVDRVSDGSPEMLKLEENLAYRLSMLAFSLGKAVAEIYSEEGLTAHQWKVFSVVCHHSPLQASRIERLVTLDKSAISRNVQALVEKGYVRRFPVAHNAKAADIKPTSLGRRIHARIARRTMKLQQELLSPFSEGQVRELLRTIHLLEARLATHHQTGGFEPEHV